MGQYYIIANMDRKEYLIPFDYGNGLKLMEWSYNKNHTILALENLLSSVWKGDRICVIGDYADLTDTTECWANTLESLLEEFGTENLYGYVSEHFSRVLPAEELRPRPYASSVEGSPISEIEAAVVDNGFRYLYNHTTRQVVDLEMSNIEWGWYDKENGKGSVAKIAPLSLLLAMGNGRGGGDYRGRNAELVGSWCASSANIEVSRKQLPWCAEYEDFHPDFTELKEAVPWTEEERVIAEAKAYVLKRDAG